MKADKMKIVRIALLALIAATLLFTFYQSSLPPEKSSETSETVGGIIEEIIPPETPPGEFVQKNLRKIAHFVEFAALGCEVAVYLILFCRRLKPILLSYAFAVIIAFIDESIQILSKRGPAISDMWIDFSGFATLSLLTYGVFFAARAVYQKIKSKGGSENG